MKSFRQLPIVLLVGAACFVGLPGTAQETVTVPKARLEELERKEAELRRLKRELQQAGDEKKQLQRAAWRVWWCQEVAHLLHYSNNCPQKNLIGTKYGSRSQMNAGLTPVVMRATNIW